MKLLVFKSHAIGDLVILTPALRRLREGLPDVRIDIFTTEWCSPVLHGNPCVDNIHIFDRNILFNHRIKSMFGSIGLLNRIKRQQYDAAVMFHRHRMYDIFLRLAGVQKRFMFNGGAGSRSVHLDEGRHSALTAWELADLTVLSLGGEEVEAPDLQDLSYEWYVSDSEYVRASRILGLHGVSDKSFVAVFPGGAENPYVRDYVRRWGVGKFASLCDMISSELDLRVILLGGRADTDVCNAVNMHSRLTHPVLSGDIDLRTTAAIMSKSSLVISNDSGPLHIAAAVGVPVVGIFGPTGARLKQPPGKISIAAQLDLPCSPCYFGHFKGCIFDTLRCMDELTSEQVFSVVCEALSRYNRESRST